MYLFCFWWKQEKGTFEYQMFHTCTGLICIWFELHTLLLGVLHLHISHLHSDLYEMSLPAA